MSKPIIDHFNSIAYTQLKEKLIANSKPTQLKVTVDHVWQAITTAFVWGNSPEGHDYWEAICQEAIDGKIETI